MSIVALEPAGPRSLPSGARRWYVELRRRQPLLTAAGVLFLLLLLPLGLAALLDARTLEGVPVWLKPMKFALAIGIYLLTLAFFAGWIDLAARTRRWFRIWLAVTVAAMVAEQTWIVVQAARGVASHFNEATVVEMIVYNLMGALAIVLTTGAALTGWMLWRRPAAGLSPALRTGAALGLIITLPLTLATAGTMGAIGSHSVGEATALAGAVPFFGWSTEIGDLRVAHFFGTHAMHAVPLATAALIPLLGARRRWPAVAVASLYAGFVGLVLVQALAARPFLPLLG